MVSFRLKTNLLVMQQFLHVFVVLLRQLLVGVIVKNGSSGAFCVIKGNKKCNKNPFLVLNFLFSILFL